jgi:Zinc finger, C3HC4 type (RING finger)
MQWSSPCLRMCSAPYAREPPLTSRTARRCGHLYCWECMHRWLQRQHTCPTCKDYVDDVRVIPIYCRECSQPDPPLPHNIPPRPAGFRLLMPAPAAARAARITGNRGSAARPRMTRSLWGALHRAAQWLPEFTAQRQLFLTQLLLFLGCLFILVLLTQ